MDLVLSFTNGKYNVSTELVNNSFNEQILKRMFQIVYKNKGKVSATSSFKAIGEVTVFVDKVFNVSFLVD